MGQKHAREFWSERDEYHDLAVAFDRNIETTYPDYVTTDRLCPWSTWSKWCRTAVKYREYRGPRIGSL
jgi:hypothetical protein